MRAGDNSVAAAQLRYPVLIVFRGLSARRLYSDALRATRRGINDFDYEKVSMSGTYCNLLYHLIFSTKNRYPLITKAIRDDLHAYMGGIVREREGIALVIGGMPDHVHLFIKVKPKFALSDVIRDVKAASSKWINETKDGFHKFGWQDGFAAFTVSQSQAPCGS